MRSYSQLIRHPGNATLFEGTTLSTLAALAGWPLHLHVEGLRGTGKTTIVRSVKTILPRISRIMGCRYNCDPVAPHCPEHAAMTPDAIEALGMELIRVPFLEISHSAKVGTVVGSIDLQRLTGASSPEAALLPGTLAQAHRGIVFVDEINRLADTSPELTDVLLDAMGTRPGRLQIEEAGFNPVEVPLQVTVWAASNPDEDPGPLEDIRRQLADRFDLQATMGRIRSREVLMDILSADQPASPPDDLQQNIITNGPGAGATAPAAAVAAALATAKAAATCRYGEVLANRARRLARASIPAILRQALADLYLECGLESLRTIEALALAAKASCAMRGGEQVSLDDLRRVVPLVIGKRADAETIARFLSRLTSSTAGLDPAPNAPRRPDKSSGPASPVASPTGAATAAGDATGTSPGASAVAHASVDAETDPQSPPQADAPMLTPSESSGSAPAATTAPITRRSWLAKLAHALTGGNRQGHAANTAAGAGQAALTVAESPGESGAAWPPTAPPQRARRLGDVPATEILRRPHAKSRE